MDETQLSIWWVDDASGSANGAAMPNRRLIFALRYHHNKITCCCAVWREDGKRMGLQRMCYKAREGDILKTYISQIYPWFRSEFMASCVYFMCVWVCVLAYTFFLHDKYEIERSKWDGMLFRSVSLRWVVHMLLQHCSNQFVTTVWIIWFSSIKKELIFFLLSLFFLLLFFKCDWWKVLSL